MHGVCYEWIVHVHWQYSVAIDLFPWSLPMLQLLYSVWVGRLVSLIRGIVLACDEKYKCVPNEVLPCLLEEPNMNASKLRVLIDGN